MFALLNYKKYENDKVGMINMKSFFNKNNTFRDDLVIRGEKEQRLANGYTLVKAH